MEEFFSMMGLHSPLITPVELYWFVCKMSMALCVMTGGTLWMPQLCVLSLDSQQMVSIELLLIQICGIISLFKAPSQ